MPKTWVTNYKLPSSTSHTANQSLTILQRDEYMYICDKATGIITLVEGPKRFNLQSHEIAMKGKQKKITLGENEYAIIRNPWSPSKGYRMGIRTVVRGPVTFAPRPHEIIESGIQDSKVLQRNEALVLLAELDFTDPAGNARKAGDRWLLKGPTLHCPRPEEKVVVDRREIIISEAEAIYVLNEDTSVIKTIPGPATYLLLENEALFYKKLTPAEYASGLGVDHDESGSYRAASLSLETGEIACILNWKSGSETEKFLLGPRTYLLGPTEGVHILSVADGVPKRDNQLYLNKLNLGPSFLIDQLSVRTSDNAELRLRVSYKYQFLLDKDSYHLPYRIPDPIGFVCHSMRSRIREAVSSEKFENFHSSPVKILRTKLFKYKTLPNGERVYGRLFNNIMFLINDINVNEIVATDKEIENLLNKSLKSSMNIYCQKLEDQAEISAQKEQILSDVELARLSQSLIQQQNENLKKKLINRAEIDAEATMESARADAQELSLIQSQRNDAEINEMKTVMAGLKGSGALYLQLQKAKSLANVTEAKIIPTGVQTLVLPGSFE